LKVKVSTVAFSKNEQLVKQLRAAFPDAEVNKEGVRIPEESLGDYFTGAEAIIVGLEKISGPLLDSLPDLKIIAKYGVGLDNIDIDACSSRNIQIGWTGGVNRRSVAEMTLGFMLALCRNLYTTSNQLKNLIWNKSGGVQLSGKAIGIIGLGNIGKELLVLLKPFNCRILVNDIADLSALENNGSFEVVSKERIYMESDIITIHTPYTKLTDNLINEKVFKQMKSGSYLINTARGGIVNEEDLRQALLSNLIAGAAIDVYNTEPPVDKALLSIPNLICTPHTGGNAEEAVIAMGESAIGHLVEYKKQKK
jgi:phosphoglycerate dehydrogenase-like enzyme